MAETKTWTGGANDGKLSTTANWNTGVAVANGDVMLIGATNQSILGETIAFTGLTVKFLEGFGGTVGTDSPVIFSDTAVVLVYGGKGSYANFGGGTYTTTNINISGGQTCILSTGTHTLLTISAGNVTVAAATVVTAMNNVSGVVTAGYNATAITTLTNAGTAYISRNVTTLNVKRGTVAHYNNGTTTFTLCTTANVEGGATYNKQSGGTDVTVNTFPGSFFTISGNAGNSVATVTVTNLNIWTGASTMEVSGGISLTVTTRNYIGVQAISLPPH